MSRVDKMNTIELGESLHKYIDLADERVLKLFREIMQMDVQAKEPIVPEWYYQLLEKELDKTPSYDWGEVKKELIEAYNL